MGKGRGGRGVAFVVGRSSGGAKVGIATAEERERVVVMVKRNVLFKAVKAMSRSVPCAVCRLAVEVSVRARDEDHLARSRGLVSKAPWSLDLTLNAKGCWPFQGEGTRAIGLKREGRGVQTDAHRGAPPAARPILSRSQGPPAQLPSQTQPCIAVVPTTRTARRARRAINHPHYKPPRPP